jgi:hypothetical protein
MTIERAISDMTRKELEDIVIKIHEALWDPEEYYEDIEWTSETADQIAEIFSQQELHPHNLGEYQE